jgi:multiple sugar transport system permease protein
MIGPPVLFLLLLVGYPFAYGIWLSLEDWPVAHAGKFVRLANFVADFNDPVFWRVAVNTFVYTFFATILKMIGGLAQGNRLNSLCNDHACQEVLVPCGDFSACS